MPDIKEKARKFLIHLLEKPEKDGTSEHNPPPPPPKPEQYNPHTQSPFSQDGNVIPAFNNLSISAGQNQSPPHGHRPSGSASFVGGFKPTHSSTGSTSSGLPRPSPHDGKPASSSNAKPPPIAMPVPQFSSAPSSPPRKQSLTMTMALEVPPHLTQRPHSNPMPHTAPPRPAAVSTTSLPAKPPPKKKPAAAVAVAASSSSSSSGPSTPTRVSARISSSGKCSPGGRSSSSSPSGTPSGKGAGKEQCAGITKAGKRCTRTVKTHAALSAFDDSSDEEGSSVVPRYCHQHSKEVMEPSGFYSRKVPVFVEFAIWIPDYLSPETKLALHVEMEKARSRSDVAGYIYTFEIRDPKNRQYIMLKVGRAVNLVKRIDQWGKQCGSKEQVLRGFYPASSESDDEGKGKSLMKGRVKAGEKSPWCHRLERLIHLELADLATSEVYLDPKWPNVPAPEPATGSGKVKDSNSAGPCVDCGSIHKEIFEFKRWGSGPNEGKEWELVVKPVIERWGKFIELYL